MLPMECLRSIVFLILVKMVDCSYRKIKDGKNIDESMRYMVYLLRSEKSETLYDAWLCGGAIVSPDFIVTSAACVKDVQYMYAIAGYSKYVNVKDINNDACTKASKKKIVFVSVPRGYKLDYAKVEKWAYIDIAVAQVESPYSFSSPLVPGCSWVPKEIKINYNKKYQSADTDAMVLGWGHTAKYRKPNDTKDYNQQELQYSSIQIMNKAECKKMYQKTPALFPIIDKYMICAMNEGNLDDRGDSIKRPGRILADGCPRGTRRVANECLPSGPSEYQYQEKKPSYDYLDGPGSYEYHQHGPSVDNPVRKDPNKYQEEKPLFDNPVRTNPNQNPDPPDDNLDEYEYQDRSRNVYNPTSINPNEYQNPLVFDSENINPNEYQDPSIIINTQGQHQNQPDEVDIITFEDIISDTRRSGKKEKKNYTDFTSSRKAGICQNDHGGPLVTWVGKIERLIGVASVFRLDKSFSCIGPYLFTSTQCNGGFLDCVINGYYEETKQITDSELLDEKPTTKPITKRDEKATKRPKEEKKTTTRTTKRQTTTKTKQTTTTKKSTTTKTKKKTTTTKTTTTKTTTTKTTTTEATTTEATDPPKTTDETETTDATEKTDSTEKTETSEDDDYEDPEPETKTTDATEKTDSTEKTKTSEDDDYEDPEPTEIDGSLRESKKKTDGTRNKQSHETNKYDETEIELEVFRRSRRAYCNRPPRQRGFDVIRRRLSWKDHPDGPAANELEDNNRQ